MINRVQISNFRNYTDLRLVIPGKSRVVVLYGKNGEGKTNILEGVSLLFTSNGLRKAKYEEMINKCSGKNYWNITVETNEEIFSSGYIQGPTSGKKVYKVNEKNVKNLAEFRRDNYILWITYEIDRLFMQSPADRRDFIDMFCKVRSSTHAQDLKDYERLTRERLKILKRYCEKEVTKDISKWLDVIEKKIVTLGIKIAQERQRITEELEENQIRNGEFPMFTNKMVGRLEDEILQTDNPENLYQEELANRRQKDGFSGSTTLGPNRSDWQVVHEGKRITADQCSAGEQKMLLVGIFFAFILHNLKTDIRNLIILLDDVVAHLDHSHREILFRYINSFVDGNENVSIWLSGTDKGLFDRLSKNTLFFEVENGSCSAAGTC